MAKTSEFKPQYRFWTPEQDAVLRRMRADGLPWPEIAAGLGRGEKGVRNRLWWLDMSPARRAEITRRKSFSSSKVRAAYKGYRSYKTDPERPAPPQFVEREERLAAMTRQSLTGALLGDPPPGFSALEQRRQEPPARGRVSLYGGAS